MFDLKAIDFFKVLDSFIHAESHLAPEIIKVCFAVYASVYYSNVILHCVSLFKLPLIILVHKLFNLIVTV